MDPDQTAPFFLSGSTLFVYEATNILADNKNIHFVIMHLNKCEFSQYYIILFGFS